MSSTDKTPRHHAYVLRFWETRSLPRDPAAQWRFSLENLRGEGKHKFPDLETLNGFLTAQMAQEESQRADDNSYQSRSEVSPVAKRENVDKKKGSDIDLSGVSLLLVEEDDAIRKSLYGWLLRTLPDVTILEADSDERAQEVARSESPGVILIDVAPPKSDGLEAVERLRAAAPSAQIVALTMNEAHERHEALLDAGAEACVKTWRFREEFVPTLNDLLGGESESRAKRTVVCIEDEIDMLSLIRFTLERHNINLVSALGGQEGLDAVEATKPDLVLLDLMMPEMDGWEVYQRIKQNEETRHIPVIILTVLDPHWIEKKGMDLTGVADYVTKPFGPQDLVERVGQALEVVA